MSDNVASPIDSSKFEHALMPTVPAVRKATSRVSVSSSHELLPTSPAIGYLPRGVGLDPVDLAQVKEMIVSNQ